MKKTSYKSLPAPRVELTITPAEQNGRRYKRVRVLVINAAGESKPVFDEVSNAAYEKAAEVLAEWALFLGVPFFEIRVKPRLTYSRTVIEGDV